MATYHERTLMDEVPGQSYEENLYAILCDYFWYATHPDKEHERGWHRDEQSEAFADRVMEFIKNELENTGV